MTVVTVYCVVFEQFCVGFVTLMECTIAHGVTAANCAADFSSGCRTFSIILARRFIGIILATVYNF